MKPMTSFKFIIFGDNFIVYNNDLDTLKMMIERCKRSYQASAQLDTFKQQYPQFYHGDLGALQQMLIHFTK